MPAAIPIDQEAIAEFCLRWGVTELALFGSVLRDDFGEESDVDVLVRFSPESCPSLFDHVVMEDELRLILGRDVDLVSRRAVEQSPNWLRRKSILGAAETIYEER